MVLSIFSVTYASYCTFDGELYTETKVFVDEDKARACQQNNIRSILEEHDMEDSYEHHANDNKFEYDTDTFAFSTKLEVVDYEFYLQAR